MNGFNLRSLLLTGVVVSSLQASPEVLDQSRSLTREWIQAEKTISHERSQWLEQKGQLLDLSHVARQRIDGLSERIDRLHRSSEGLRDEMRRLETDREALSEEFERYQALLTLVERRLLNLKSRLPDPLLESLESQLAVMEDVETRAERSVVERLRVIVEVTAAIREFDRKVHLHERIQTLPGSSQEASVRTIWLGLGQAYYLAPNDAGVGILSDDGWVWRSQPQLEGTIRDAMALIEGRGGPPQWLLLPVKLKEGES